MYDQSLEQLIDAVIADGVITDQERRVVYKKAASLGIDQDEIEVYLNGRLDKLNGTLSSQSTKHGTIRTCPNCGAHVDAFETKCKECGFEFKNTNAVESMEKFIRKLSAAKDIKKKCELIQTYPIPNDKESLLEFLSVSIPNSKDALGAFDKGFARWFMIGCGVIIIISLVYIIFGFDTRVILPIGVLASLVFAYIACRIGKDNSIAKAWEIKTNTALNKLKIVSVDNAEIKSQINLIVKNYKVAKKKRNIIFACVGILTLILISWTFITNPSMTDVNKYILNGQYIEAEQAINQVNQRARKWERYDNYQKFMHQCVTQMCENGEFDKAKIFTRDKGIQLKKYSSFGDHPKEDLENLQEIISSYQDVK